jgi:tetratricopeptide (TPR) repeat protein
VLSWQAFKEGFDLRIMRKIHPGKAACAALIASILVAIGAARADDGSRVKASELVATAIKMTDSQQALKLLWQATDIDPTYYEAYTYLGLYYNSRQDFAKVADVYKRLVKYSPRESSAYLNIGEAYLSFNPPKRDEALTYYRKAYEIDPRSSFAALRIGEILAQQGNVEEATRYLKQASADTGRNGPEADKILKQMGVM